MRFSSNNVKKLFLYSFIGLFVGGGVIITSTKKAEASVVYSLLTENTTTSVTSCTYISEGSFVGDGSTLTTSSQITFKGSKTDGLDVQFYISTNSSMPDGITNGDAVLYFPTSAGYASGYWNDTTVLVNSTTYYILVFSCNGSTPVLTGDNSGGMGFEITGEINTGDTSLSNTNTRIVSFTPVDGFVATTSNATTTVDFNLHAYVNENDIGNFLTVKINYRNIDQNSLLNAPCTSLDIAGTCSSYTFTLFSGTATTSGDFYFASTSVLARGNYRVEASIDTATQLLGLNLGFFTFLGAQSQVQNHQFIVGSSTFIGNISQNLFTEVDSFFGSLPATSTEALAGTCNPLGGVFDIRQCMAFLFIPDANHLKTSMENLRIGVFQKMPFGYLTRVIDLLATSSTTTLPVLSYTFQSDSPLSGDTLSFDTGAYMQQASALSAQMVSNTDGQTVWEIFALPVKLFIYLVLVFAMMKDITGLPFINHRK